MSKFYSSVKLVMYSFNSNNFNVDDLQSNLNLEPPKLSCIRDEVAKNLKLYLMEVGDTQVTNLYSNIIEQVDSAVIATVLQYTGQNQSQAAHLLGLNRGTLRSKIQKLGI